MNLVLKNSLLIQNTKLAFTENDPVYTSQYHVYERY